MRKGVQAIIWVGVAVGVIGLYFSSNVRGYYRFKEICEKEGGLRVFHPLKKGAGWKAKKHWGHLMAAHLEHVAFVRYVDGAEYDIRYRGGLVGLDESYDISLADEKKPVVYELVAINQSLAGETRTSRSGYEVREIATGRLMVRWYQIGYSTFDQDHTLLAAPSGQACYFAGDFSTPENQAKYFSD